jgi:hypothetical protein
MAGITIGLNGTKVNSAQSFFNALLNTDSLNFPNENILHRYRVFNYVVTLAIVSPEEYNTQSYKTKGFDYIVFKSAGKPFGAQKPASGKTLTSDQIDLNAFAKSGQGQYDFYLEDLYVKSAFGNQQDWATSLKLKIIEPYSIDNFMKTVQVGLKTKSFKNFEKGCPFIVKIEFVGYKDGATTSMSEEPEMIPFSTRYYPVMMQSIKASLTKQGTAYELTTAPLNEAAVYDDINKVASRFTVKGNTLGEVMTDLEKQLDDYATQKEKESKYLSNRYKIAFAKYIGGELVRGDNDLSKIEMYNQFSDVGNREFSYDTNGYLVSNPKQEEKPGQKQLLFQVNGASGLIKIIDTLVLDSQYIVQQIKNKFSTVDGSGNFDYYRIIPEVKLKTYDSAAGRMIYETTYLIVQIKISKAKLPMNTNPLSPSEIERSLARTYQWQYTGENRDIINFNIDFNMFWVRLLEAGYGQTGALPGQDAGAATEGRVAFSAPAQGQDLNDKTTASMAPSIVANDPSSNKSTSDRGQARTSAETDPNNRLAKTMHRNINNPYEKVMFEMDLLGDPMWLGCQFIDSNLKMGGDSDSNLFTTDGGFALRTVEPKIKVLAYAPIDFNSDGLLVSDGTYSNAPKLGFQPLAPFPKYDDPAGASTTTNGQPLGRSPTWSAYYQVTGVESFFQGGVFKQKLKGYRLYTEEQVDPSVPVDKKG